MEDGYEVTLKDLSILVVDDDVATCELLTLFLGMYGAAVSVAFSAEEGLKAFNQVQPDLLISDVCMPNITGHTLIKRIRALEASTGKQTPAIALSALASKKDQLNSLEVGFQRHVTKPVEPDILLAEILSLLRLLK